MNSGLEPWPSTVSEEVEYFKLFLTILVERHGVKAITEEMSLDAIRKLPRRVSE